MSQDIVTVSTIDRDIPLKETDLVLGESYRVFVEESGNSNRLVGGILPAILDAETVGKIFFAEEEDPHGPSIEKYLTLTHPYLGNTPSVFPYPSKSNTFIFPVNGYKNTAMTLFEVHPNGLPAWINGNIPLVWSGKVLDEHDIYISGVLEHPTVKGAGFMLTVISPHIQDDEEFYGLLESEHYNTIHKVGERRQKWIIDVGRIGRQRPAINSNTGLADIITSELFRTKKSVPNERIEIDDLLK